MLNIVNFWTILKFCSKAFNYSITSTFDSTQTDRLAVKVKVALPLRAHEQNRPDGS